jgi:hypothetical protein
VVNNTPGEIIIAGKKVHQNFGWDIRVSGKDTKILYPYLETTKREVNSYLQDKDNFYVRVSKIDKFDYEGIVYDFETETHTIGMPFIIHNSNDGTVSGATLTYDGLVNTASGIAYIPSDTAYGEWEFNFNKKLDMNTIVVYPIQTENDFSGNGYRLSIKYNEAIELDKITNGAYGGNIFYSGEGYIDPNTDYHIKITRSLAGVFTVYIKGGDFGWDSWTTVGTATNNTYTTSNYFVADLDAGDKVSNLKINGKPVRLSNATVVAPAVYTTTAPSYKFDGVDDYIDITESLSDISTNTGTISLWAKTDSENEYLFGISDGTTNNYLGIGSYNIGGNVKTRIACRTGGTTKFFLYTDNDVFSDNEYHNIVITQNGTEPKMYIDSILVDQTFTSSNDKTTWISDLVSPTDAYIGTMGFSVSTYAFDGQISGLKIWNRILTTDEIEYLYESEKHNYEDVTYEIPSNYELVMSFDDNASSTSTLRLKDLDGNSCLVDWGDGILQEISTSSETTSRIAPSNVKIYSRNGLAYFYSTNNNFDFNVNILPTNLTYFLCSGSNTVSGDLADLPTNLTYFLCSGSNTVSTYTSPHTFNSSINYFLLLPATGYGLDSTEVDNLLIDLNTSGMSTGTIDISGENAGRTSASDAAVNELTGVDPVGKTVSVTTN